MEAEQARVLIESMLSEPRYRHSLGVAETARELARVFGIDEEKAYLTGLLHDYAKGVSGSTLLEIAAAKGLVEDDIERQAPDLLHAAVGAWMLEHELGINDADILNAVRFHTLGDANMSVLDKIIYLADMIEPGRDYPGIERIRCLAQRNLDTAMLAAIDTTIKYCLDHGRLIHPRGITVRNALIVSLPENPELC
ncbi:MAG: bis(5'-nucleosyl)-tetraphosphatase (symmetrical) YqeK [Acidobacteriota bacterium]